MSDLHKARLQFNNWVQLWVNSNAKEKVLQPDILEIMTIFKILGFDVSFTEISPPNDATKLKNSRDGLRIVATCSTSGIKGIMELETSCSCPKSVIESKLWDNNKPNDLVKYTIDKKNIDALIAVPPGIEYIIQSVTNHFLHLIKNNDQNANQIETIIKTPSEELQTVSPKFLPKSPKLKNLSRQHTFLNIYNYNPTIQVTSPARYRSLDTLTGDINISEIPEPGKLRKNESNDKNLQLFRSSNVNLANIRVPSTSSPYENGEPNILGYNKLLAAQTLINEVLGIMENKQNADKLNFDVSKIKVQGSVDSVIEKRLTVPAEIVSAPKVPSMKPKCRAPIRSTGSVRQSVTKSPITRPISKSTSSAPSTKSLENVSGGGIQQKTPTIKPNPKYMHIKSTISKTKTIITTKK